MQTPMANKIFTKEIVDYNISAKVLFTNKILLFTNKKHSCIEVFSWLTYSNTSSTSFKGFGLSAPS